MFTNDTVYTLYVRAAAISLLVPVDAKIAFHTLSALIRLLLLSVFPLLYSCLWVYLKYLHHVRKTEILFFNIKQPILFVCSFVWVVVKLAHCKNDSKNVKWQHDGDDKNNYTRTKKTTSSLLFTVTKANTFMLWICSSLCSLFEFGFFALLYFSLFWFVM